MKTIYYLSLALLLWSCGANNTDATTGTINTVSVDPYGISDSIRQLYQVYQNEQTNIFPLNCRPERGKVNPADQAPQDTVFFVFREHLQQVVADKDIFGLLANIDEQIKTGLGTENGLRAFIQAWELDTPEKVPQSKLWRELGKALALGGQFNSQGDTFEAPYLNVCFPSNSPIENADAQVVTGAGVRMRSAPNLNSRIVKTLSYDLLQHIEVTPIEETIAGEIHPWIKVKTIDDEEGFVYGKFLHSPTDFRAVFRRRDNGQWKLVSLLARN